MHAQLRMQCSNLNYHLFNLNAVDSPSSSCSYKCEDANHYLLPTTYYLPPTTYLSNASEMQKLMSVLEQLCMVNVQVLLFGSNKHSYAENRVIFKSVDNFILESN